MKPMESSGLRPGRTRPHWGRPTALAEQWTRVAMILYDRQIVFLDRLITDIRASTGVVVKRTDIVRALIDGLIDAKVDLTSARDASDIRDFISRAGCTPREDAPRN